MAKTHDDDDRPDAGGDPNAPVRPEDTPYRENPDPDGADPAFEPRPGDPVKATDIGPEATKRAQKAAARKAAAEPARPAVLQDLLDENERLRKQVAKLQGVSDPDEEGEGTEYWCHMPADTYAPRLKVRAATPGDAEREYKTAAGIITAGHPISVSEVVEEEPADEAAPKKAARKSRKK